MNPGAPRPSRSLLEEAAHILAEGPCATVELGTRILGLRGNASAISSAVFALLGRDSRFQVSREGIWTLAEGTPLPGPPLHDLSFAVVDVETTGGAWDSGHRVTEVAVVPVEQGQVGEGFHTLVNPGRSIPPRIQGLTGITNRMVAEAPYFTGIAPTVQGSLEGRIFVAHNVSFDWGFISRELNEAVGDAPSVPRLCTVRLGRLLAPEVRRFGLDYLTDHFRIPIHARHRAYGDALATARLLLRLLDRARDRGIHDLPALERALNGKRKRPTRRGGGVGEDGEDSIA